MIHSIPPCSIYIIDSLFYNLSPSPLWSTTLSGTRHFILRTFLHQSLSSFRNTCPYHRNLFCRSTKIMSSNSSLSLKFLLGTLYFTMNSALKWDKIGSTEMRDEVYQQSTLENGLCCKCVTIKLCTSNSERKTAGQKSTGMTHTIK